MLMNDLLIAAGLGLFIGLLIAAFVVLFLRRRGRSDSLEGATVTTEIIAERVRATGKLVGLEVTAKEIATAKKGWDWLPPLLMSPAQVAMIFHFDKQYSVELGRISASNIEHLGIGSYRLTLPPIDGQLRLTDVKPYDIQDGKVLGLLDVIQMKANAQGQLMQKAQEEAAKLFEQSDQGYQEEAQRSIGKHLEALFHLIGAEVEVVWTDPVERESHEPEFSMPVNAKAQKSFGDRAKSAILAAAI
jgi:hypothetical protein